MHVLIAQPLIKLSLLSWSKHITAVPLKPWFFCCKSILLATNYVCHWEFANIDVKIFFCVKQRANLQSILVIYHYLPVINYIKQNSEILYFLCTANKCIFDLFLAKKHLFVPVYACICENGEQMVWLQLLSVKPNPIQISQKTKCQWFGCVMWSVVLSSNSISGSHWIENHAHFWMSFKTHDVAHLHILSIYWRYYRANSYRYLETL